MAPKAPIEPKPSKLINDIDVVGQVDLSKGTNTSTETSQDGQKSEAVTFVAEKEFKIPLDPNERKHYEIIVKSQKETISSLRKKLIKFESEDKEKRSADKLEGNKTEE